MVLGGWGSCPRAKRKPFIRVFPSSSLPRPMASVSTAATRPPAPQGTQTGSAAGAALLATGCGTGMVTTNSRSPFCSTLAVSRFPAAMRRRFSVAVRLSTRTMSFPASFMPSRARVACTTGMGHCCPMALTVTFAISFPPSGGHSADSVFLL